MHVGDDEGNASQAIDTSSADWVATAVQRVYNHAVAHAPNTSESDGLRWTEVADGMASFLQVRCGGLFVVAVYVAHALTCL